MAIPTPQPAFEATRQRRPQPSCAWLCRESTRPGRIGQDTLDAGLGRGDSVKVRVALFSDTHGNLEGVRAVLSAIRRRGADMIVCAGDMLGGGGGHEDLLDLLMDADVTMLMGNHEQGDADIASMLPLIPEGWREWVLRTHDWLRGHLSAPYWRRLAELPLTITVELSPNRSLLACHAAPEDPRAQICGTEAPVSELRRAYGQLRADTVAHGHFHQHHVQWLDGKLLVNVASVGLRFDGRSAFSVLEHRDERWIVEQYLVPYDLDAEMRLMRERKAPEPPYHLLRAPLA
jgi:predicted phosphodiesterase